MDYRVGLVRILGLSFMCWNFAFAADIGRAKREISVDPAGYRSHVQKLIQDACGKGPIRAPLKDRYGLIIKVPSPPPLPGTSKAICEHCSGNCPNDGCNPYGSSIKGKCVTDPGCTGQGIACHYASHCEYEGL